MQRIISLVPSQTELLYHLGLDEAVVGITKFCVYPEQWFRTKTRIGGTKNIDIEKIKALKPYLVIANKEENVQAQVEALQPFTKVYVSDVATLADALLMMEDIGGLTGKTAQAASLVQSISEAFSALPPLAAAIPAAYCIWKDPWMVAGGDTFIHAMMEACGFRNVFQHVTRYPEADMQTIIASGCKRLLLSSEPYPFGPQHASALRPLLPGIDIVCVDGEMFSWYGSRLLLTPAYFTQLRQQLALV